MSNPNEEVREQLIEAQNHLRDIEKKPFCDVPHAVEEAACCLDDALSIMRCADEDGEGWYTWRVLRKVDGEETQRLLVPWSDPHQYEFAFDFIYTTTDEAYKGLKTMGAEDDAHEEGWILCHMTLHRIDAL